MKNYYRGSLPSQRRSAAYVDEKPRSPRLVPLSPITELSQSLFRTVGNALGSQRIASLMDVQREPDLMSVASSADCNARFVNRKPITELDPIDPWRGLGSRSRDGSRHTIPDALHRQPVEPEAYKFTPQLLADLCRHVTAYYDHAIIPQHNRDFSEEGSATIKKYRPKMPLQPCLTNKHRDSFKKSPFNQHQSKKPLVDPSNR